MIEKLSRFDPEKNYIISVSNDKICKWDAETGVCVQNISTRKTYARSVSISADGKKIMYMLNNGKIYVYSIGNLFGNGKTFDTSIKSAAMSPDGKRIVTGSDDGNLKIWNIEKKTPEVLERTRVTSSPIVTVSISSDRIACGYGSGIKVYDFNLNEVKLFLLGYSGLNEISINSVSFSPDNRHIVCAHTEGLDVMDLYSVEDDTRKTFRIEKKNYYALTDTDISSASFSPDGKRIVAAGPGNNVHVMDLDCNILKTLEGHTSYVTSALFSADGNYIVSGSQDNTVRIWDVVHKFLKNDNILKKHTDTVYSIAYVGKRTSATPTSDVRNNGLQLRF